jgi:2,3-bisphosphoglycerate-dependent phosphoglycerate mutase
VETGHLAYSCFGDVGFGDVDGEDSGQTMPLWCVDDRLQEINNGILSGLTWPEAQQRHSKLCQALEQSADWLAIPGAESPVQCQARARSFIEELQGCHGNGDRIWVISHGGILPYLVAALVGSDRTWGFQSQPTAIFEFVWDADRWRQLEQSAHRPNSPQNSQHNYQQNRFNTTLWQIRQFNDFSHNQ